MLIGKVHISSPHQTTHSLPMEEHRMDANQQDSHFKLTSDYLHTINKRAAEWMPISRIYISSPHQTTHSLAMEE